MIINPIIPIWLMAIICATAIILIIYNTRIKLKIKNKQKTPIISICTKIAIIILLFIMNLRFMLPNGESIAMNSNTSILFVIDKSVSMKALDYNGKKERLEGVIKDCCYIVDELSNCRFSIMTFGDTVEKLIPFTNDTDMVQAELQSITTESTSYSSGTSINLVKEKLEKELKKEKQSKNSKIVLFFITDGEITKEGEKLENFSSIKQYISNGAVMGYGTTQGGKMINDTYSDNPNSEFYYVYYYENYQMVTAVSKIDEKTLKQISSDIGIDYVQMSKTSDIDNKLSSIKRQIVGSQESEQKINTYTDIYYYFAIPLMTLLTIDFIIKKRRM